jgi:hypothetical protein
MLFTVGKIISARRPDAIRLTLKAVPIVRKQPRYSFLAPQSPQSRRLLDRVVYPIDGCIRFVPDPIRKAFGKGDTIKDNEWGACSTLETDVIQKKNLPKTVPSPSV